MNRTMNAPLPSHTLATPSSKPALHYDDLARVSNEVAATLATRLARETQGEVLFSPGDRARYATDASIYQVQPVGVLVPRTDVDVRMAIDIARDLRVPIVPRGAGSSQCGQTVGAGLVLDMSKHLNNVLHIDADTFEADVQPGIVLDHLNARLKPLGLWYPVDVSTSAQATLGGMAGNNSCGSRSIAWGNMVHNVLGMRAWLSDGELLDFGPFAQAGGRVRQMGESIQALAHALRPEIDAHWPKVLRRVAGYNLDVFRPQSVRPYTSDGSVNLAHLLVGSEGTLAVTQSLKLKLSPLPRHKVLGVVNFASFHKAMDSAQHIVPLGPQAVELVDRTMIELALQNPAFAPVIRSALIGRPEAILLVEFAGDDKAVLNRQLDTLIERMGDLGLPGSVAELRDEGPQKNLWEVRKAGLNIMMSLKGDGKPVSFIEDCAVPLEHLAEYTDALTQVFARHGTRGTWYAHASVGTLHVRPILDMRTAGPQGGAARMRAIAEEAAELVRKYRGAYSGEHGDGLCRGEWVRWQFGPRLHEALAQIKQTFDPMGLLCPRRIVDPPRMDDQRLMRFSPDYRVIPLQPVLDWSAWNVQNDPRTEAITAPGTGGDPAQGLAKAVEMCNNNGHCRKFDAGTMCPSYRVTRDERHLTRGRANTLRLALSGQLQGGATRAEGDTQGLASEAVHEALELCVSCKGCKRDCPTGVDMARLKIEHRAAYVARHGSSLRERLVARLPAYARAASRLAPLLNALNTLPGSAALRERFTGFSARRRLPRWQSRHAFAQALVGTVDRDAVLAAAKPVVLWVDTFNGYFESENAIAACKVLVASGYSVHIATKSVATDHATDSSHLCCGRTYLAAGRVDEARAQMRELIDNLLPFAQRGIAIVGLEPSCLLGLRDEALAMRLGDAAQTVAAQALLFEEFLAREARNGHLDTLQSRLKPAQHPIVLHGHCHQKAFGLMPEVLAALRLIPQAEPRLIESSCCGMAGSFGYEAEHYDVSMQMGELSLLPAVRAAPADAWIVASGTSCRHQIADGAARDALHVAAVLAAHLNGETR